MVYVFLDSLEPPSTSNRYQPRRNDDNLVLFEAKKKLAKLCRGDKEDYRKRWVTNAIDPYLMSHVFEMQLFASMRLLEKTGKANMDPTPDFELSRRNYQEGLLELFKQKYPSIYSIIKQWKNESFKEDSIIFQYLR